MSTEEIEAENNLNAALIKMRKVLRQKPNKTDEDIRKLNNILVFMKAFFDGEEI